MGRQSFEMAMHDTRLCRVVDESGIEAFHIPHQVGSLPEQWTPANGQRQTQLRWAVCSWGLSWRQDFRWKTVPPVLTPATR